MTFSFYESDENEKKVVNTKEEELVTEAVRLNAEVSSFADKILRMIINEADKLSRGSNNTTKFVFVESIIMSIRSKIKSEQLKDIKTKNDQRTQQKAAEAYSQNQQKTA